MKIEWAPHIIPCVAMLFQMRKVGEPLDRCGEQQGEAAHLGRAGRGVEPDGGLPARQRDRTAPGSGNYGGVGPVLDPI